MNDNLTTNAFKEAESPAFLVGAVMRSCIHCGNKDQSKFDVWEELDYNDGADEAHTGANYLINVEYGTCLVCGENI
jgi:hypothetical protein